MMDGMRPGDLVNWFYEELLHDRYEAINAMVAPDYFSHTEASEVDRKSLKRSCQNMVAGWTGLKREVLLVLSDDAFGTVVHRYTATDKRSGQKIRLRSSDTYRLKNGKLAEHWGVLQFEEAPPAG